MRFNPTEKAKGLLRDWHQMCQDEESNAQPAWNKVILRSLQTTGLSLSVWQCGGLTPSQCAPSSSCCALSVQ